MSRIDDIEPEFLPPELREAFAFTLYNLCEVFFVSTPRMGRTVVGPLSGLPTDQTWYNRSFPIKTFLPTFKRYNRDTRLISLDLKRVVTGTADPRCMPQMFLQLLERWNIQPPKVQYRFLLAYDPANDSGLIYHRADAERFVRFEDDMWNGRYTAQDYPLLNNIKWPVGAQHEDWKDEDLKSAVRPAFGFWLFPIEALGPLKEDGVPEEQGFLFRAKRILDFTDFPPELCLTNL